MLSSGFCLAAARKINRVHVLFHCFLTFLSCVSGGGCACVCARCFLYYWVCVICESVYNGNDNSVNFYPLLVCQFPTMLTLGREEVFGSDGGGGHIAGQHLVSQSFCRWRQQYQEQRAEEELQKVMLR